MKFLYTNVELNLPHHLSYVATLPCKCTQRIMHVKPLASMKLLDGVYKLDAISNA